MPAKRASRYAERTTSTELCSVKSFIRFIQGLSRAPVQPSTKPAGGKETVQLLADRVLGEHTTVLALL